ncbi:MAG: VOC family protein [Solirubrobacterales bacterium]
MREPTSPSAATASPRPQGFFPSLAYGDAERAVDWLEVAFGFELIFSVPGDGGGVLHAELRTLEGDIIMVLSTQLSTRRSRSPRSLGGTAQSVYLVTSDVDGLHERAAGAGAEVFNRPRDTGYGREFCCLDPEGHIWTFGTYRPDASI